MFVYGKAGRKMPYSVKLLTQMMLAQLLSSNLNKNIFLKENNFKKNYLIHFVTLFFTDGNFKMGFQDPASGLMEGIIDLHHDIMFFLIWVVILVSFLVFEFVIGKPCKDGGFFSKLNHSSMLLEKDAKKDIFLAEQIQHNTVLEII